MNFWSHDWRDRRTFHHQGLPFGTMHHTIANYSTDPNMTKKPDLKSFEENIFTKIHSIPDPLKKNLADTVITGNNKEKIETPVEEKEFYYESDIGPTFTETMEHSQQRRDFYPSLTGITSFISNVFGTISGAMFQRRPKSPVSQYYDCFDSDSDIPHKMASESWQPANLVDQNKKRALEQSGLANDDMNNCRATVAQVESKISAVRDLLTSKSLPNVSKTPKIRPRRPKRAFIEAGAVTDSYEDHSTADNYVSLSNDDYIEFIAIPNNSNEQFCDIEAAKMKTQVGIVPESTDIVNTIPDVTPKVQISTPTVINKTESNEDAKTVVIASCEDKLAKLKAMLSDKRKKTKLSSESTETIDEPISQNLQKSEKISPLIIETALPPKSIENQTTVKENTQKPPKPTKVIPIEKKQDKRFKNPCRLTDKRRKCRVRNNIKEDMTFANELDSEEISSVENSPAIKSTMQRLPKAIPITKKPDKDSFDEVKGRFRSASTDSDDSFQIVFSDSPKLTRMRRPSDCDSEDSFIVFEGSPNNCYTSNNLFEHSTDDSDTEMSDIDSEMSDSGCPTDVCKLSHTLSRTFSDLTDNSLFDESKPLEKTSVVEELDSDEVDCAARTEWKELGDVRVKELSPVKEESPEVESDSESANRGLLIDEAKKLKRKGLPPKKVKFSEKPPKVHVMRVWSFAARQARAGHWERYSLDRERFKRRIADIDMAISWVLKPQHRNRIMFQRFMPWWNKQKRIEAAERKQREAEEKIRKEEERQKKERESAIEEDVVFEMQTIQQYEDSFVQHIVDLIEAEIEEKKLQAIRDLKELLDQDKKKLKRKKEREKKMEAEINKSKTVANGKVVGLKC
ncbi:phosphatase-1 catalytic subunit binding region domain-containing protein [Phthorimaea operculella]|nr:phosphatase-1 catalytic subunit binding region domain-containing protein [Phthorimaea operculella]